MTAPSFRPSTANGLCANRFNHAPLRDCGLITSYHPSPSQLRRWAVPDCKIFRTTAAKNGIGESVTCFQVIPAYAAKTVHTPHTLVNPQAITPLSILWVIVCTPVRGLSLPYRFVVAHFLWVCMTLCTHIYMCTLTRACFQYIRYTVVPLYQCCICT